jgi:hypothetical protein
MAPLRASMRPLQGRSVSGPAFRGRCPSADGLLYAALAGHGGRVSTLAAANPNWMSVPNPRLTVPL